MAKSQAAPQRMVPAFGILYDALAEYWYPVFRILFGAMFVPHGMQKLFGMFGAPPIARYVQSFARMGGWANDSGWVYYIGCLEFFGGICIALGFLTRVFAIQFIGFMTVAVLLGNGPRGYWWTVGGWETPLFWGIAFIVIFANGGGKWSVDRAIGREF